MKVAITGGSGFVGQELTKQLILTGHEVYILTRSDRESSSSVRYVKWLSDGAKPEEFLDGIDAWVNLAGSSINDGRWTKDQKHKIYNSRMDATNEVLRILDTVSIKPSVLVNASAIGIYPSSEQATYTEQSSARSSDFLGKTADHWERRALKAEQYGTRVAFGRFGIILGKDSGALPLISRPYRMGVGGRVGSGKQWMSWVHVTDVVKAILYVIGHDDFEGPFNLTSPNPKQMSVFGEIVGEVLHRPHWMPVPSFALKIALGDKSKLVLEGQRVMPEKLLTHGFKFEYPDLSNALENIYA